MGCTPAPLGQPLLAYSGFAPPVFTLKAMDFVRWVVHQVKFQVAKPQDECWAEPLGALQSAVPSLLSRSCRQFLAGTAGLGLPCLPKWGGEVRSKALPGKPLVLPDPTVLSPVWSSTAKGTWSCPWVGFLGQWPYCTISRGLSPTSLLSKHFRANEA